METETEKTTGQKEVQEPAEQKQKITIDTSGSSSFARSSTVFSIIGVAMIFAIMIILLLLSVGEGPEGGMIAVIIPGLLGSALIMFALSGIANGLSKMAKATEIYVAEKKKKYDIKEY